MKDETDNVEISDSMIEEIKQSTLAMFEATVMGANKESKDFSSSNEYLMVRFTYVKKFAVHSLTLCRINCYYRF